jgi:hypothetical protein
MMRPCWPWAVALGFLIGCSGGSGSSGGGAASSSAPSGQTAVAAATASPYVAVADIEGSGSPTTFLVDTSRPSGSRVVQAIGTDSTGSLVDKGSSADAETMADAVANAAAHGSSGQPTTVTVALSSQTVPALVQALK